MGPEPKRGAPHAPLRNLGYLDAHHGQHHPSSYQSAYALLGINAHYRSAGTDDRRGADQRLDTKRLTLMSGRISLPSSGRHERRKGNLLRRHRDVRTGHRNLALAVADGDRLSEPVDELVAVGGEVPAPKCPLTRVCGPKASPKTTARSSDMSARCQFEGEPHADEPATDPPCSRWLRRLPWLGS